MPEQLKRLSVAFFDGAQLELFLDDKPLSDAGKKALSNFLSLGADGRLAASRHVFAYYLDQKAAFEKIGFKPDTMPDISAAERVWDYVQAKLVFVQHDHYSAGNEPYVAIEADCDWHAERGLMLCFRWGNSLTKCGGFNGHVTNRNAFADDSLVDVVYRGIDPTFTTREDP
jgi:hypothetical protein